MLTHFKARRAVNCLGAQGRTGNYSSAYGVTARLSPTIASQPVARIQIHVNGDVAGALPSTYLFEYQDLRNRELW
jgi:hypothetical protein